MFETAMQEMVNLGHDINPEHWTEGERGFSNVCLNCGRVIGVLKTGELWGTALTGPCPDRRFTVCEHRREPSLEIKAEAGAPKQGHQEVNGMLIFLGFLAISIGTMVVLMHFQLLSGFLVVLARISVGISLVLLILAIFRRRGFKGRLAHAGSYHYVCAAFFCLHVFKAGSRVEDERTGSTAED